MRRIMRRIHNSNTAFFILMVLVILVFIWFAILGNFQTRSDKNRVELLRVIAVVDGDTIILENKERVRYIGINTPETKDPRRAVQCFGKEAAKRNDKIVAGRIVRLERDVSERDKYGRLLRYVWIDDMMVNLELVKEGYAYASSYPPNVKYQDLFRRAEREARETKKGLWAACPEKRKRS